jgi:hypothetical protein
MGMVNIHSLLLVDLPQRRRPSPFYNPARDLRSGSYILNTCVRLGVNLAAMHPDQSQLSPLKNDVTYLGTSDYGN